MTLTPHLPHRICQVSHHKRFDSKRPNPHSFALFFRDPFAVPGFFFFLIGALAIGDVIVMFDSTSSVKPLATFGGTFLTGPPCLPWRDFLGKYCNFYIIYKSWQYSLIPIVSGQVWARGATCLE